MQAGIGRPISRESGSVSKWFAFAFFAKESRTTNWSCR